MNKEKILDKAKENLKSLIKLLSSIEIKEPVKFYMHSSEFRTLDLCENKLDEIGKIKKPLVYVIEIIDNKEELLEQFASFEKQNKIYTKNVDRINHSKNNKSSSSNILYVGSCIKTNFRNRMIVHLGLSNTIRTYGLHLSRWSKEIDYNIKITIYYIDSKTDLDKKGYIVELIEQTIWDKYKPIFGKRSGH